MHYFVNDQAGLTIKDTIQNVSAQLTIRGDFVGYNIISNSVSIKDTIFPELPKCI